MSKFDLNDVLSEFAEDMLLLRILRGSTLEDVAVTEENYLFETVQELKNWLKEYEKEHILVGNSEMDDWLNEKIEKNSYSIATQQWSHRRELGWEVYTKFVVVSDKLPTDSLSNFFKNELIPRPSK